MTEQVLIPLLVFVVAVLYASVGHGGASGYLALLGVLGIKAAQIRPSALLLNVVVAGISFVSYYRSGHFRWKLFYPFALLSVPMTYLGSLIELDPTLYKQLLAGCLLLAVLRILGVFGSRASENQVNIPIVWGILIGASLGFLSGLIGIGGGILLSPILLLFRWASLKETAAVSSLFIVVNSIAGLIGLGQEGFVLNPQLIWWILAGVAGALLGSYWGSVKAQNKGLKQVLAGVLLLAAVKLFFS